MLNKLIVVLAALCLSIGISHAEAKGKGVEKSTTQVQAMEMVNINKASAEEIAEKLKGIGMKKAVAVVELRNQLGGFKKVEQITDVKGIGPSTLEKNRKLIKL